MMHRLEIEALGPIQNADITFGDLTVLVGPQASGKSLFVQTYKAIQDRHAIRDEFGSYGFSWRRDEAVQKFCAAYYGGGYDSLLDNTVLRSEGKPIAASAIALPRRGKNISQDESVYLIPAQRVLVLHDGWPGRFLSYQGGDPYCLKHFSESVRLLMENELRDARAIFPQSQRLKKGLRSLLDTSIYAGGKLQVETHGGRKRIVLEQGGSNLPSGVWSAGQREFTPLLMGLLWLLPSSKIRKRAAIETVIIEEPEMGLHPQAIVSVGLLLFELMARGYKVIVSTHSPVILDIVWAVKELQGSIAQGDTSEKRAMIALRTIFGTKSTQTQINAILKSALKSHHTTYYFERKEGGVYTKDISSLDPSDDDVSVSGWGGLSGFSGNIADAVGNAL